MQVCLACSTETEETGRFCPECGAVLAAGAIDAVAATQHGSTGSNPAAASLIGLLVDGFAIEAVHGGGSFGTVYRGRQVGLDRIVAIKVPTHEIAADPVQARRFAREARAASRVHHPGVVAIHAVGELPDGRPYLAMQLVEGRPLDTIIADGPVPPIRALELARQIASALSETHASEVVHRDLKPSNVVWHVDRNGDDRLTLVDFGIAVCKPGTADATRLTAGGLIGTPHYMSPEQAHGEIVDARADLYALGCILFELLTATTPFDGSGFEVLLAHLGRPPPRPSERVPELPPSIDRLVGALMAKKPDERPASADALVALIDDTLDELEGVRPPSEAPTERPSSRTRRKSQSPTSRDRPAVQRPSTVPPGASETAPASLTAPAASRPAVAAASSRPVAAASSRPASSRPASSRPATAPGSTRARTAPPGRDDAGRTKPSLGLRIRYLAVGAAGALALTAATFTAMQLTSGRAAITDDGGGGGSNQKRREIFRDDGETRLRVFVPDPMRIRKGGQRVFLELRNKLGQRLEAEQVIVTIQDPNGKATGVIARPRQADPTQYSFFYDYQLAGMHLVRIFPPETSSSFDVTLDVAPAAPP